MRQLRAAAESSAVSSAMASAMASVPFSAMASVPSSAMAPLLASAMASLLSVLAALPVALALAVPAGAQPPTIAIGSKAFPESRLLAEMLAQLVEAHTDCRVERRFGLGGTLLCFEALQQGAIDVYPEYTGTAWSVLLHRPEPPRDALQAYVTVEREFAREHGLRWLQPLGFDNTYALAMRQADAERLGLQALSQLAAQPQLRAGFSPEFLERKDGWPGLRDAYGLRLASVRGLEHGLAYAALAAGDVDLIDVYSTDGKLQQFELTLLRDDRGFFPPYQAAPLVRAATLQRLPQLEAVLDRLAFRIDDATMRRLNHQVEGEGRTFAAVAAEFLRGQQLLDAGAAVAPAASRRVGFLRLLQQRGGRTLALAGQHLLLTGVAVLLAALLAIPLGIVGAARPRLRRPLLAVAGVLQTIPSLALLAFMIPWLGLGADAAIAALLLYALLPILRNTVAGIAGVRPELVEAARGLGLYERQVLLRVQLPLAARTIMAGLRTATVISIGVATLAAFVGAGGLGEPIVTGLQLADSDLILCGAVPAAALALLVDALLALVERRLLPRGS